jgi:hypothetical protein
VLVLAKRSARSTELIPSVLHRRHVSNAASAGRFASAEPRTQLLGDGDRHASPLGVDPDPSHPTHAAAPTAVPAVESAFGPSSPPAIYASPPWRRRRHRRRADRWALWWTPAGIEAAAALFSGLLRSGSGRLGLWPFTFSPRHGSVAVCIGLHNLAL